MENTVEWCGWCNALVDTVPAHKHYAVLVRENGKLLGRLAPGGRTARNKVYALILSRARADQIAADINNGSERNLVSGLSAKVIPF